jgi:hypothetical protein
MADNKDPNQKNRAKRSLGRSITTRATCPAKRSVSAKMSPSSRPTLTGNKVATINKMKSAEFARADAEGIFEVHNSFVGLEHQLKKSLKTSEVGVSYRRGSAMAQA